LFQRQLRLIFRSSIALLLPLAAVSQAQVLKVKDFDLDPNRDRRVLFSLATTPKDDILSFVATGSGNWVLYRASAWLTAKPTVQKLILRGFYSRNDKERDGRALETLDARVFSTQDGAYAICIGSAEWLKRVNGQSVGDAISDDFISIVDLQSFKVIATAHTGKLELFEFHEIDLDDEGFIRIGSLASGKDKHSAFIRLSVPSLQPGPRCAYDSIAESSGKYRRQVITESECSATLKAKPLDEYLEEGRPLPQLKPSVCNDNKSNFCQIGGQVTPDNKFGVGLWETGHDTLFGGYSTSSSKFIIFSLSRGVDIREIKEPTNDSFHMRLFSIDGIDYISVAQSGTHLMIYKLQD
jgi:hypothetical protein